MTPARDRRSARARAARSASSASRWRSSRRRRSVLSMTTTLTPSSSPSGAYTGQNELTQWRTSPGADAVAPVISRSSTGRPLRTTALWASATRSPAAPKISPTVRPRCSSTERSFMAASAAFTRT